MGRIAQLWVKIAADFDDLSKGFAEIDKATQTMGTKLSAVGGTLTRGVTLPLAAMGAGAFAAAEKMDDAFDTIRSSTGATGEKLAGLESVFNEVFRNVPVSADAAATAVTELSKRTNQSGPALAALSEQVLNLSRLTKEDLSQTIASSTRAFGDWSISTDKQAATLDMVFRASQQTGAGVNSLLEKVVQFGAPLRQLRFGFEESIAILGKWEKEGVNAELVLGSLRIGLANFAKAGRDAPEALRDVIGQIQTMSSAAEATGLAIKTFGARAGPDMAAAIREGRFAIDELVAQIAGGSDTIALATKDTDGWRESLTILANRVIQAVEPIGLQLVGALEKLMPLFIKGIQFVADLTTKFANLTGESQAIIGIMVGVAAALGPVLSVVGTLIPLAKTLGVGIGALATPVGLAVAAFVSLGAAGIALAENWKIITYEVNRLIDGVHNALVTQFNVVVDSVKAAVTAVRTAFLGAWDAITSTTEMLLRALKTHLVDSFTGITQTIERLLQRVAGFFRTAYDTVTTVVRQLITAVHDQLVARFTAIVDAIKAKIEAVTGFFKTMYDKVAGNSYVPDMMDVVGYELGPRLETVKNTASDHIEGVTASFSEVGTAVEGIATSTMDTVSTQFGGRFKDIVGEVGEILLGGGGLKDLFGKGVDEVLALGQNLVAGLKDSLVVKFKNVLEDFLKMWDTIKATVSKVVDVIGKLASAAGPTGAPGAQPGKDFQYDFSQPIAGAANMKGVEKRLDDANKALTMIGNLIGIGNALLATLVLRPAATSVAGGGGGGSLAQGGVTITGDIHLHGVEDPEDFWRRLQRIATVEARRGGVTDLQLAIG